jgi:hypothetical protein
MNVQFENFIGIFDNAYTEDFCSKVIEWFEYMDRCGYTAGRTESKIYKNDTQLFHENETWIQYPNHDIHFEFSNVFWNEIHKIYVEKFEVLTMYDEYAIFSNKLQRTKVGQGYHLWHSETSNRRVSNRILAYTLYLNNVDEGGETEFLYYPLRVRPKTGRLIMWPAGFTHTHRGNPPLSNTKYIMTGWLEY